MPRKKQTEEVKPIGETVDELSSEKVILDATLPPELEQEVDTKITTEQTNESAGASIIEVVESTVTTPPTFEQPQATNLSPVEMVKKEEPETVTVNKKALYRLVQALNRNQVHMYIGTAATRFLGDLFALDTLVKRTAKWEEVKKWNEENH